jgi:hypothetical protein
VRSKEPLLRGLICSHLSLERGTKEGRGHFSADQEIIGCKQLHIYKNECPFFSENKSIALLVCKSMELHSMSFTHISPSIRFFFSILHGGSYTCDKMTNYNVSSKFAYKIDSAKD